MPPRVSIVVPAHNSERWLSETVESVRGQTLRDWELVIVDDGSSDKTAKIATTIAAGDSRVRLLSQDFLGATAARNAGVYASHPNSRFLSFLDPGDIWLPETLYTLVAALEDDPDAHGAHGLAQFVDDLGEPVAGGRLEEWGRRRAFVNGWKLAPCAPDDSTWFKSLAMGNYMPVGTIVLRRVAAEEASLFDESISACADWDLWLRMGLGGHYAFVDKLVVKCRRSVHMAVDRREVAAGHFRFATKILRSGKLNHIQRLQFVGSRPTPLLLHWALASLGRGQLGTAGMCAVVAARNLILLGLPGLMGPNHIDGAPRI